MPLVDLPRPPREPPPPRSIRRFIREANRRIERFRRDCHVPAFVPSDFAGAYAALSFLDESGCLSGNSFCEWGSGFGVTTCLAAMLGFRATGIEIDGELVDAARSLAEDYGIEAEFARGSFIPAGADDFVDAASECAWLSSVAGGGHEALGLDPDDFDVIFAYPWPDEECLTAALFERYARAGAVLLTDHEVGGLRLRRRRRTERVTR
jgi:predicted O-methyltransferase YrrM